MYVEVRGSASPTHSIDEINQSTTMCAAEYERRTNQILTAQLSSPNSATKEPQLPVTIPVTLGEPGSEKTKKITRKNYEKFPP